MERSLECPMCRRLASAGDFLCPGCETILDPSVLEVAPEPDRERSLVRSLLSPPEATPVMQIPEPPADLGSGGFTAPGEATTRRMGHVLDPESIPVVVLGLDPRQAPLSAFEAYVVSLLDARTTVDQLSKLSGLSAAETQAIMRSLQQRKVVEIRPPRLGASAETDLTPPLRRSKPGRKARTPAAPPDKRPARRDTDENPVEVPLQRAIALERQGRWKEAAFAMADAIALTPKPAPLYNRLALALLREGRDLAIARTMLGRALEHEPANKVYLENMRKIVYQQNASTKPQRRIHPR